MRMRCAKPCTQLSISPLAVAFALACDAIVSPLCVDAPHWGACAIESLPPSISLASSEDGTVPCMFGLYWQCRVSWLHLYPLLPPISPLDVGPTVRFLHQQVKSEL